MKQEAFFVIGCGRSATTAIARMLATATNVESHVEDPPKLQIESRDLIKGVLRDPQSVIYRLKNPSVVGARDRGKIYGDKNPCYLPFIPHLLRSWNSRIVFLSRDGRDVVRSSMNWVENYRSNGFAMAEDDPASLSKLPTDDYWDYSRLRPNPGEEYFAEWKSLSRFEKYCWHWSHFNQMALTLLAREDRNRWIHIDVSNADVSNIERLFAFLDLEGFDHSTIDGMVRRRINSTEEKSGQSILYPGWDNWSVEQRSIFRKHAGPVMQMLGYCKAGEQCA